MMQQGYGNDATNEKKIFFGAKIMHGLVMWLDSAKRLKGSEVNFVTITPLISFINFNALHCGM